MLNPAWVSRSGSAQPRSLSVSWSVRVYLLDVLVNLVRSELLLAHVSEGLSKLSAEESGQGGDHQKQVSDCLSMMVSKRSSDESVELCHFLRPPLRRCPRRRHSAAFNRLRRSPSYRYFTIGDMQ